jgi:hypothetical protein
MLVSLIRAMVASLDWLPRPLLVESH